MILSRIRNQHGEEIPEREVYYDPDEGLWCLAELNCYSSQDYGLGTCRCVSHSTYRVSPVSRREVRELVGNNITNLTEEEIDSLNASPETLIEERFRLLGFSWEEVEEWALQCYRLGVNPLPALRKALEGVEVKVGFMYDTQGAAWVSEEDTLVCRLHMEDTPEWVSLEYHQGEGGERIEE